MLRLRSTVLRSPKSAALLPGDKSSGFPIPCRRTVPMVSNHELPSKLSPPGDAILGGEVKMFDRVSAHCSAIEMLNADS